MEQPLTALGFTVKQSEEELMPLLVKARKRVERKIDQASRNPKISSSISERNNLYKAISGVYESLSGQLDAWTERLVKRAMSDFHRRGWDDLGEPDSASITKFSQKHLADYFRIVNPDTAKNFTAVSGAHIKQMGRMRESDITQLREAFVEEFRINQVTGGTARELQKAMEGRFSKIAADGTNSWQFMDRGGRTWKNSNYFNMVTRTANREIANQAYMDTVIEAGGDLASIEGGGNPCPKCARWRGVIVSISGADNRFPSYADAKAAGVFHPNCVCQVSYVDPDINADDVEAQANVPNPTEPTAEEWTRYQRDIERNAVDKAGVFSKTQAEKQDKALDKELKAAESERYIKEAQGVFKPATSMKEVRSRLKRYADRVSLPPELTVDLGNDILEAAEDSLALDNIKLKSLTFAKGEGYKGQYERVTSRAQPGIIEDRVRFSKSADYSTKTRAQLAQERADRVTRLEARGLGDLVSDDYRKSPYFAIGDTHGLKGAAYHEFGHAAYFRRAEGLVGEVPSDPKLVGDWLNVVKGVSRDEQLAISEYAATVDHEELFAESYAHWKLGQDIPEKIKRFLIDRGF